MLWNLQFRFGVQQRFTDVFGAVVFGVGTGIEMAVVRFCQILLEVVGGLIYFLLIQAGAKPGDLNAAFEKIIERQGVGATATDS